MDHVSDLSVMQGVLRDNSGSPDVYIQRCARDHSRNKLLNAKRTSDMKVMDKTAVPVTEYPVASQVKNTNKVETHLIEEKIDRLEGSTLKNKVLLERTEQLEKKITEITDQRLQYLEQLQQQQHQWQMQYFKTMEKLHANQNSTEKVHEPMYVANNIPQGGISIPELSPPRHRNELLSTPLPRYSIPKPSTDVNHGNGQLFQRLLEQSGSQYTPKVGTRHPAASMHDLDVTPVRETPLVIREPADHLKVQVRRQETKAAEIEREVEREEISKKFPSSITEYLQPPPGAGKSHGDFIDGIEPQGSMTADLKTQLNKVSNCRSTFENNLSKLQLQSSHGFITANATDDGLARKEHIKKMVDAHIEEISAQKQQDEPPQSKTLESRKLTQKAIKPSKPPERRPRVRPRNVPAKVKYDPEMDESMATHVYGPAEYHPRRTTVQPGGSSKNRKFRMKRAVESVPGTHVRSEKSQTCDLPTAPSYLFSPNRSMSSRVTPGNLVPVAMPLGPPMIYDSGAMPVIVPAHKACQSSFQQSPPIRKTQPTCDSARPRAHDASIEVHAIGTDHDLSEGESQAASIESIIGGEIQVEGCYEEQHQPKSPFPIPKKKDAKAEDYAQAVKSSAVEDQALHRIEEELLARVLSHLSKKQPHEAGGPSSDAHDTGFPLSLDAHEPLDDETMQDLLEGAIREITQSMMNNMVHEKCKTPKMVKPPPRSPTACYGELATPQPTPAASPVPSRPSSAEGIHHMMTPDVTPDISSVETSHVEPPASPVECLTSPAISEASNEQPMTPPASPPPDLPDVEYQPSEVAPESSTSSLSFDDPWEGNPPSEEGYLQTAKKTIKFHIPPVDEQVMIVPVQRTPSPVSVSIKSSTEATSTSELTSRNEDGTISDGQLIISHGEIKHTGPRKFDVSDKSETMTNLPDLDDDEDEPISVGQLHVTKRGPFAAREDPAGIFSRPRQGTDHAADDDSLGEITSRNRRRERFRKWKKSRADRLPERPADDSADEQDTSAHPQLLVVRPAGADRLPERPADDSVDEQDTSAHPQLLVVRPAGAFVIPSDDEDDSINEAT